MNDPEETSMESEQKHPVPKWLWVAGALILAAHQTGYQLTRHYELINAVTVFFVVAWVIIYAKKRAGH